MTKRMNITEIVMKIKSTDQSLFACEQLFNESQASFALEQSKEQTKQEGLKATNHKTIDDEDDRKQSVNMQFWHSIKQVVFVIACAAIVIYTLIHFA